MPETPGELHARAAEALRTPPLEDRDTWPFEGELRPGRFGQLRSSFAEIWDEVLPPTPQHIWDDNLDRVVRALEADGTDRL
jgi:hypothetical protein